MSQNDRLCQNPFKWRSGEINRLWNSVYTIFENDEFFFCLQVENIWDKIFLASEMKGTTISIFVVCIDLFLHICINTLKSEHYKRKIIQETC